MKSRIGIAGTVIFVTLATALTGQEAAKSAAERGALSVRGQPAMNPPVWSVKAYENLWTRWGVKEKPADYARAVQERYGLHAATYPNGGLPMGLHYTQGLLGKGIVNDCLMCHASVVAGQTVVGAANASLDLQGLFEDLNTLDKLPYIFPFRFSIARGTIDPVNSATFLMEFRDADLNLQTPTKLDYSDNIASVPPAWWLLKRKETRNWTGGVRVNDTRIDMVNLLHPFNSAAHIKSHEKTFEDIHAFVLSVESPKYPFPIDASLAATGRGLFTETCARCHGTYGPDGKYPSKIVPLDTLGTDATLAKSLSAKNIAYFNKSWFGRLKAADGTKLEIVETPGYQAPPLDGIWATAPFFHNASVPSIYHVLNSKARPMYWTRTYSTAKDDYDSANLGWKTTALGAPAAANLSAHERRKIYDATQPGRSNAGHTFGDQFTEDERRAVIEYLKTL
jgi:RoxA-like, cytochrome c-like